MTLNDTFFTWRLPLKVALWVSMGVCSVVASTSPPPSLTSPALVQRDSARIKCNNDPLPRASFFPHNIPYYAFRDLSNLCYTHAIHNGGCHCILNRKPAVRTGGSWVVDCTSPPGDSDLVWSRAITACYMGCSCEPPPPQSNPSTLILHGPFIQALMRQGPSFCTTLSGIKGVVQESLPDTLDKKRKEENPADTLCPPEHRCADVEDGNKPLMWGTGSTFPLGLRAPR